MNDRLTDLERMDEIQRSLNELPGPVFTYWQTTQSISNFKWLCTTLRKYLIAERALTAAPVETSRCVGCGHDWHERSACKKGLVCPCFCIVDKSERYRTSGYKQPTPEGGTALCPKCGHKGHSAHNQGDCVLCDCEKQQPPAAGLRLTKLAVRQIGIAGKSIDHPNTIPSLCADWLHLHADNERLRGELADANLDAGQARLIAQYANEHMAWNGVENSKILSTYIQREFEDLQENLTAERTRREAAEQRCAVYEKAILAMRDIIEALLSNAEQALAKGGA